MLEFVKLQKGKEIKISITKDDAGVEYAVINNEIALAACGRRLIIKEDPYRTGYECIVCDGVGHVGVKCDRCSGTQFDLSDSERGMCRDCRVKTEVGIKAIGYKLCDSCKGIGTKGGIVVPQNAERRPSSGVVISTGEDIRKFKKGDRVLYSNYGGTPMSFKGVEAVKILMEDEIMCKIYGVAKATPEEKYNEEFQQVGID